MKCADWLGPLVEADLRLALVWKRSDIGFERTLTLVLGEALASEASRLARERFIVDDGSNLRILKRDPGESKAPLQVVFVGIHLESFWSPKLTVINHS